jgi:hypothetical protein
MLCTVDQKSEDLIYTSVEAWNYATSNLILRSGFRRDVDEICGLLGYYTASCGNCLPTFWDNVSVPSSRNPEDHRFPQISYYKHFFTVYGWWQTNIKHWQNGGRQQKIEALRDKLPVFIFFTKNFTLMSYLSITIIRFLNHFRCKIN